MPQAGQIIYASDINDRLGTTTRTSDSTPVTTTETVADSITVSLIAGRRYRVRWLPGYTSSVAADSLFLRIREDTVSGTQLQLGRVQSPLTNGGGSRWPAAIEAEYTAAATGSKTFVGTYVRASGTGNVNIAAGPTYPTYLYVEYIRE